VVHLNFLSWISCVYKLLSKIGCFFRALLWPNPLKKNVNKTKNIYVNCKNKIIKIVIYITIHVATKIVIYIQYAVKTEKINAQMHYRAHARRSLSTVSVFICLLNINIAIWKLKNMNTLLIWKLKNMYSFFSYTLM
jgi:hypothetical protein